MNESKSESTKIEFLQYHLPQVKAGLYRVKVEQKVTVPESGAVVASTHPFSSTHSFSIRGERTVLNPQEVLSVFPPSGSSGDHANVLPHVVLRRSTLPWERASQAGDKLAPWLAVLLFNEDQAPKLQTVSLEQLYGQIPLEQEPEEHHEDKVTVIDVPSALLKKIVPTATELALLAHCRINQAEQDKAEQDQAEQDKVSDERSVVVANRLPRRGQTSVAHLVSMENRYQGGVFATKGKDLVRLVSLKSWRFHCLDEQCFMITESVLKKLASKGFSEASCAALRSQALLNKEIVTQQAFLSHPVVKTVLDAMEATDKSLLLHVALYKKLGFKSLLMGLSRDQLCLPKKSDGPGEAFRQRSYVPLPHHLRDHNNTLSWYHGPLISGQNKQASGFTARAADELLLRHKDNGMRDVSYGAAWEIGRLLMLQSKATSVALYQWKRAHASQIKDLKYQIDHLPFGAINPPDMPTSVSSWLNELAILKPLPFNYLVPDERMLPRESLRFFCVDKLWVECLIDGAFSIGRVSKHQAERDSAHVETNGVTKFPYPVVSGIMIRSDVVSGWPDLQLDGYEQAHADLTEPRSEKLTVLRMERLSANVIICLFGGNAPVNTVDIHQKPEGLHFGVSEPDALHFDGQSYYKLLRNLETGEEQQRPVKVPIDWRPEQTSDDNSYPYSRKINIEQLADSMGTKTSDTFALQMIEGVQKVRFTTAK
jgi:hypothetical protein